jgi:hypothetical protein
MRKLALITALLLSATAFAQQGLPSGGTSVTVQPFDPASDGVVVVGNRAQPVQWYHRSTILEAISKAQPNGTVIIPSSYMGSECNPVSTCNPGLVTVIDWRLGGSGGLTLPLNPAFNSLTVASTGTFGSLSHQAVFLVPNPSNLPDYSGGVVSGPSGDFIGNGAGDAGRAADTAPDELEDVLGILYWNPVGSAGQAQQVLTAIPFPLSSPAPSGLVYAISNGQLALGAPASFPNGITAPSVAGFAPKANGQFGYDSSGPNWQFWDNGASLIMAPLAPGFVSGNCGQPTSVSGSWRIADTGSPCGAGGSSGITGQTAGQIPIAGSATTITGSVPAPAGAIVGTTDVQVIDHKDLTAVTNTFPTLNQNTSGTAANLSGTPALPNGTTATTQTPGDNTTKLATTAYVLANAGGSAPGSPPVGQVPAGNASGSAYVLQEKAWKDIRDYYDATGALHTADFGLAISNIYTKFGTGVAVDYSGLCSGSGGPVTVYGRTNPYHSVGSGFTSYNRAKCNLQWITSVSINTPGTAQEWIGPPSSGTSTSGPASIISGFDVEPCVPVAGCGPNSYAQFPVSLATPVAGSAVCAGPPAPACTAYTTGTATFTNGSTAVTGAGTTWDATMVGGWAYSGTGAINNACVGYIRSVNSTTSITLANQPSSSCTINAGSGVAGTYTILKPNALVVWWKGSGAIEVGGASSGDLNNNCFNQHYEQFRVDLEGLPNGIGVYTTNCQENNTDISSNSTMDGGHQGGIGCSGSSCHGFPDLNAAYVPPIAIGFQDNYYSNTGSQSGTVHNTIVDMTIGMGAEPAVNCALGNSYGYVIQGWSFLRTHTEGGPNDVSFSTVNGTSTCAFTDNVYVDGVQGGRVWIGHMEFSTNAFLHVGANNKTFLHAGVGSCANMTAGIPCVFYDTNAASGNVLSYVEVNANGMTMVKDAAASQSILSTSTQQSTQYNQLTVTSRKSVTQKPETGADATLLTYTPPTSAGTYRICFALSLSAASAATLGWTATWKDSNGNAQSPTNLSLRQTGVAAPALTFTTSATANYGDCAVIDVDNSATNIVVKTTFAGTSFSGKASATIEKLSF